MLARDIEMFIEHCGLKGLSTKTINSYEQTLRLFMQYMDEQGILLTEKITHLAIQGYIKSIKERGKYTVTTNPNSGNYPDRRVDFGKRVSDVTINNYLRNLRVFFNWCVEEELILRSPVKKGDFVKVERKPLEFVSDEDFKRLLKNMNSASFSEYRDSIIIQLLLDTGMRVNECLLIEVTDLDMVKRCISLPADNTKGKKARYVFFSDKMATQLQRWIKYKDRYRDSDFLFCTNKGKRIQVSNFEANVRKYAQRIGLNDIHPHVFRNNFAKRFLMSGGDIYTLMWFIEKERDEVLRLSRGISAHIRAANTISPVNMSEFEERRLQLDKALECCNVLQDELNYIAKVLPADKNKYTRIVLKLEKDFNLIKKLRQSDNGRFLPHIQAAAKSE